MSNFKKGDRVRFIDPEVADLAGCSGVVKDIYSDPLAEHPDVLYVLFDGVDEVDGDDYPGWFANRFELESRPSPGAQSTRSKSRKETPIYSGPLSYFPLAIRAVARLSFKANEKHNPGEPLHWSREKSKDHLDCITRHLLEVGQIDPEFDELHDTAVAWRALANFQLAEEKRLGINKETK